MTGASNTPPPPTDNSHSGPPNIIDLMIESILWKKAGSGGAFVSLAINQASPQAFGLFVTFPNSKP